MGGLYYNVWSCTGCQFQDKSISGPFRVEAKEGVYKAQIEYRYCFDCDTVTRCFTGKAEEYKLSDLKCTAGSKLIYKWRWKPLEAAILRVSELESEQRKNFFFFFLKKAKELKLLKSAIVECQELNARATDFYNLKKPKPRCLICGSENISGVDWNKDVHKCGGKFMRVDSGRVGSVGACNVIRYDANGFASHDKESLR